jgi:hypothetical protein
MGNNGSDFTVGAVLLKRGMGNFFKGQIGGLAVFNRALDEDELQGAVGIGPEITTGSLIRKTFVCFR